MRWSQPSSMSGLADDFAAVKSWCNVVEGNAQSDADIDAMIRAAMGRVEQYQRRQLLSATYAVYLDEWPEGATIEIRDKLPIRSIVSVQYKDEDGDTQTVSSANYHTSLASYHSPARIVPVSGYAWPTLQTGALERVTVNLTAGYGTADQIPWTTRAAIRMMVAAMVDNPSAVVVGATVAELPNQLKRLLDADCWTIGAY